MEELTDFGALHSLSVSVSFAREVAVEMDHGHSYLLQAFI